MLLTAEQIRELDRRAIDELGIPGPVLMENAGRGATDRLEQHFAGLFPGPVRICVGKGNNGGDGFVIARHLVNRGWTVQLVSLAAPEAFAGDARLNFDIWQKGGGELHFATDSAAWKALQVRLPQPRLIVDALFGTGLASEVRGHYATVIDAINASGLHVLAVDIPSGVDATRGKILGTAVAATLTVTFAAGKPGLFLEPGASRCGTVETVDIGIPTAFMATLQPTLFHSDVAAVCPLWPARPRNGHKGSFGHLLLLAGSRGKSGAAALSAQAALRAGAGLVTVASPESAQRDLAIKLTEVMTEPLPELEGGVALAAQPALAALCRAKEVVALGPGLGLAPETVALVRQLVPEIKAPLVIDADGLNAIVGVCDLLSSRSIGTTVLTPHPGEMARLCDCSIVEVEADRIGCARDFARRYGVVLVLKGAGTLIATPSGEVSINASGNPGMATAGMGDLLTGMIAALLAQGLETEQAAKLGVFWHGAAGDYVAKRLGTCGLLAGDLLPALPQSRNELLHKGETR